MFYPLLLYFSASVKNREENAAGKVKALQRGLCKITAFSSRKNLGICCGHILDKPYRE